MLANYFKYLPRAMYAAILFNWAEPRDFDRTMFDYAIRGRYTGR